MHAHTHTHSKDIPTQYTLSKGCSKFNQWFPASSFNVSLHNRKTVKTFKPKSSGPNMTVSESVPLNTSAMETKNKY